MAKLIPGRKTTQAVATRTVSMAAARVDLKDPSWNTYKLRNETWQIEAWRFYELIGELHFVANWIGSACSRVRLYIADVDKFGRIGEETSHPEVGAITDQLFGGPAGRSEALRAIGINLTVAGECYIVGRSFANKNDEWIIVSPSELRRQGKGLIINLGKGIRETVEPPKDIAFRVWTAHPRFPWEADSPVRAGLLILREIEKLTQYVFSQIDSRLSGAGILVIPANMDFPQNPDAEPVETFVDILGEAMSASMEQDGTAKSVVPIVVERPEGGGEDNKFEHITFESPLSEKISEYRADVTRRLAIAMDLPPEILSGTGDTNHWSAWHIEESAVKIHVEPMMTRICEALTKAYLHPILKLTGQNPDEFSFWFDTSPLTVRPNRLQDTLNLYERGIVRSRAVLEAGAYNPNVDAPDEEEDNKRFMRELVLRDPTLFAVPEIREVLGIDIDIATPPVGQEVVPGQPEAGPPPPPAPERDTPSSTPELPQQPAQTAPASQGSGGGDGFVASADPDLVPAPSALVVAADLLVHRALELTGKRLHKSRDRDQWSQFPTHELHTRLRVRDYEHAERLLMGAWEHLGVATAYLHVNQDDLRGLLHSYSKELLVRAMPHSQGLLMIALQRGGFLG